MVKFLTFEIFDNQNLPPSEPDESLEPLEIIAALNDFLVSTKGGTILHYTIGATESTILNRFAAQSKHIIAIHYLPANDAILTLERETDTSKIQVVRLYQNWRQNQSFEDASHGLSSSPIVSSSPIIGGGNNNNNNNNSSSLASMLLQQQQQQQQHGHANSSSNSHGNGNVSLPTVLKIPLATTVTAINVCPVTSRVVVATEKNVSLWSSVSGGHLITSFERILDIDAENVKKVAIYDGYIAYSTLVDVKILSLNIHYQEPIAETTANSQITPPSNAAVNNGPSEIVEDEHYFEVNFDGNGNQTGKNQLSLLQMVNSNQHVDENVHEIIGPITDIDHGISVNTDFGYILLSSTLVLSRRFSQDDNIHSLFFLPDGSHSSIDELNISNNSNTQQSTNVHQHQQHNNQNQQQQQQHSNSNHGKIQSMQMRCVFSTQKEGFLYNISKPSLLAYYMYASDTVFCAANHCFLYTLSADGIQTWSLRTCEGAEHGNDIPAPCGFGMKRFIGLSSMAVMGEYLVILSKIANDITESLTPSFMRSPSRVLSPKKQVDGHSNSSKSSSKQIWSIYILHHTPLQSLYTQILEYATAVKDKDEDVYHQLLLEGHFLLQSKLSNQFRSNPNMNDVASIVNHDVERKNFKKLLRKSSSFLGENQQDYMRAALWYSSSDTDIELVFNMLKENKESQKALSYYLKQVLFNPSSVELLADKEDLSNKILEHYYSESPHNLSFLILESSVSSYSQKLAIDLLKRLSETCDFDLEQRNMNYFALGLLYLDQNNIEDTMSSLNQIPVDSLIKLCLKNPKLLLTTMGENNPTALGKILRQSIPWGLLEITIQLVRKKDISPDEAFTILLHSTTTFATNGILNSNSSNYHHEDFDMDALLLKIYLEWFLNEHCNAINVNNIGSLVTLSTTSSTSNLVELVPPFIKYLIHLYVQDIHRFRGDDKQLFQSLNIDVAMIVNYTPTNKISSTNKQHPQSQLNNMITTDEYCNHWIMYHLKTYSIIPQWLSKLPPFSLDFNRNPSEKEDPNNQLSSLYYRKIQSLLSTTKVTDFEFMENVELMFASDPENIMFVSLQLACLPLLDRTDEGIKLATNTDIAIMLEYGLHFCKHNDWSVVLDQMLRRYLAVSHEVQNQLILLEYERVLDYLTSYMDPEAFLQLLPSNGKMDYFLPFIEKSFSNHYAKLLKAKLTDFLFVE
ncbi:hypothetical protein PPL_03359 [Heterostelium album PN500]|uniref:BLOC-2 complex member HPS3 C-terminal domain-containing protein n=1 Tax=Heterostelium pallidum (strain ATCC 26659 / Pp 5 / PN500) TaxID=670386 RepID=D3B4N4_HETP5|nr:hypothetical protein PPL_03359 [Heterostelium album PN500]EFA84282.1 hypothetical protein PPL_03359 [Heterostelium album PN500]|eukprot:XP_020436398.1 hypothetical protein PPL_03359 [Heterostelium album PN500]